MAILVGREFEDAKQVFVMAPSLLFLLIRQGRRKCVCPIYILVPANIHEFGDNSIRELLRQMLSDTVVEACGLLVRARLGSMADQVSYGGHAGR